jgi:5-(hydroxymethyl)furfural/furfural oxidase
MHKCDFLVVGGGSAGCVMASRLSEDPSARVILIEAGPDDQSRVVQSARFLTYNRPPYYWNLADEKGAPFGQPKIVGGGSALNAMHAQRGDPSDYDEWRQLGVEGWNYDDVVPYFEKVEDDGSGRSGRGKVPITRVSKAKWSGLSRSIAETLSARNLPELADVNREHGEGFGPVSLTMNGSERASAASAYLSASVRQRKNLSILAEHSAKKLLFDGRRVVGIEAENSGGDVVIEARETILCCGAVLSPTLLLQSGIGSAADLAAAGVCCCPLKA